MSNKRIVANTAATYTRTVFGAGVALCSSRWVLNALGPSDYGLFCVVGSVIIFITFLNNVLAASAARHFAFCLGQQDDAELKRWFNAATSIHLCLAFFLVVCGWPLGEYVVTHLLTVPSGRVAVCVWVFRASLLSAFFSMLSVPFVGMFTAKQRISELAVWGGLQSVLVFTLALCLRFGSGDLLRFYTAGMVAIVVLVQSCQIIRALFVFRECRSSHRLGFDRHRCKEIFSFAVWNMIGSAGALGRDQGSAILLNVFFGPGVNAAYGIANQVSSQANQLSAAMIGAFSPEITACEGRGDRVRMLALSQSASKFGTVLILLLAIPLMVEMEYVLKLWLRHPPAYTAVFCQMILGTFLIDRLSVGYMLAVNAYGKIAGYQATLGTIILLTLPLGWLFLKMGLAPTSIGIAFLATISITSVGRVLWGRRLLGMPVGQWFSSVVGPCLAVTAVSGAASLVMHHLLPESFGRLLLVAAVSTAATLLSAWVACLNGDEKKFLGERFRSFSTKSGNRSAEKPSDPLQEKAEEKEGALTIE